MTMRTTLRAIRDLAALGLVLCGILEAAADGRPLEAGHDPAHPWCATRYRPIEETLAIHAYDVSRQRLSRKSGPSPLNQDIREIAVLVNDGAISPKNNPLDLEQRTLIFRPNPRGGFDLQGGPGGPSDFPGSPFKLPDHGSRRFGLLFAFPFA